nr:MAG TPA: hypothetical protein [Caudoviricetes sp.]
MRVCQYFTSNYKSTSYAILLFFLTKNLYEFITLLTILVKTFYVVDV